MPDVVVVGAGPAGSTLAYRLAQRGIDVALLEKSGLPRVKPCGGGLDATFFQYIPDGIDVTPFVQDWTVEVVVRYQGGHERTFPLPENVGMAERSSLDHFLVIQAQEMGVHVRDNATVDRVERQPDGTYEVDAGGETLRARVVVGADGAYSSVARLTDIATPRTIFVAAEWDLHAPAEVLEEWRGRMLFDCSVRPVGYAWVFPKEHYLNIGFGLPQRLARMVHTFTEDFARRTGLDPAWGYERRAHWLPFARKGSEAVKDGVVLVGDAAGVADPTSGAGISWSVRSSAQAAPWIERSLNGEGLAALAGYQHDYEDRLAEVDAGLALRNVFFAAMALRRRIPEAMFQRIIQVANGQGSYLDWRGDHPWLYRLGKLMEAVAGRRLA